MFSETNLRSSVLSASIILSAIGFSSLSAEAQEKSQPAGDAAVATAPFHDTQMLNRSSNIERLSGALKDVKPPPYDGPVAWKKSLTTEAQLGIAGLAAGLGALIASSLVAKATENEYRNGRKIATGAAVGAALLAGPCLLALEPTSVIEFETTIKTVVSAEAPHMETHHSGKSSTTTGPYFGQVVAIPETDMLLASNSYQAPLVPGQRVIAKFYVNADNQIISWTASPGARQ